MSELVVHKKRSTNHNPCHDVKPQQGVDRSNMRVKKGRLRLSPNEEAQLVKEETEKRRKLRIQQVREQSKENAAKIRHAVKEEKHKLLMKLATDIKSQLEEEKAERVRHLEQQYDNSLRNIGVGHKQAGEQPDWSEERDMVERAENIRAESRGRAAVEKMKQENEHKRREAQKHIIARKNALEKERERAAEIAAMPPPPPDPLENLETKKPKPVKVTDMNTFSTSHFHLQNEHAVDRACPQEQGNAREAAGLEQDRISQRALELKQLRQDQLERARLRHNAALEKELLKHDYGNILHDLSDLQRADRERRLKIVHHIPKQVFEPPNFRMEDREEKQRDLEQEFEDMYMAGTDHHGDISMALDPQPPPLTPSREDSLDITAIESPLVEPTLPSVPPVLRDMTNVPKPRSPGKKPEKVLRNLMNRIKSQREEWMTSHSLVEMGQGGQSQLVNGDSAVSEDGQFQMLILDDSPAHSTGGFAVPVTAPPTAPLPQRDRQTAMQPEEFAEKLRQANEWQQQTNVQLQHDVPADLPQGELADVLKQQELILEQKRELELKLQRLTHEQHKLQLSKTAASHMPQAPPTVPAYTQPPAPMMPPVQQTSIPPAQHQQQRVSDHLTMGNQLGPTAGIPAQAPSAGIRQDPVPGVGSGMVPQPSAAAGQQHLFSSMSSSGTSQHPMNSIPPTRTTNSIPMTMTAQGQMQQGQLFVRSAYQPPSAALTTDQLVGPSVAPHPQTLETSQQFSRAPHLAGVTMQTHSQTNGYPDPLTPSSLTTEAHTNQMRKVREYQQYLLARHEQSKKVLDETKEEIRRRRENLLHRYPKLDLSRLTDLGAKYLENYNTTSAAEGVLPKEAVGSSEGQGQQVPVTSLLASLAAHPYYQATLSQQGAPQPVTVANAQSNQSHPDINLETNMRKNKFDTIRKSLPFDGDETLQQTPDRVYEAYAQKSLDVTSATDVTESDTSTLTERGSPALRAASKSSQQQRGGTLAQQIEETMTTTEESDMDTTTSGSFLTEREDVSAATDMRQEELQKQLADIQQQKDEIIRRHEMGQQRLISKESELKAKLAAAAQGETTQQPQVTTSQQMQPVPPPASHQRGATGPITHGQLSHPPSNLSTILEVDTPASADKLSDNDRRSSGESSEMSSKRTLDFSSGVWAELIPEEPSPSETKKPNGNLGAQQTVAEYSGKNIDDVLERAKRFEREVLEKLRKQTNAVLFDNEFDNSLEFNTSRHQLSVSEEKLSSGSLSPDSLSTGPLDDSSINRSRNLQSADGSFQTSRSWADELAQYKQLPSNQSSKFFNSESDKSSDPSFKLMQPDSDRSSMERQSGQESSMFANERNRFKVYSQINEASDSETPRSGENVNKDAAAVLDSVTTNAGDMLQHLRDLQRELRSGDEMREMLAKKLVESQKVSADKSNTDLSQYSFDSEQVSRPFMPGDNSKSELSQYSITDNSADILSTSVMDQSRSHGRSRDSPVQSGTSSKEKELPVRRSPIGEHLSAESPVLPTNQASHQQEVTTTEYSFTVTDGKHRSTSTPGQDRRKSALDGQMSVTSRSELPSAITTGDKSSSVHFNDSLSSGPLSDASPSFPGVKTKTPADGADLSSYTPSSVQDENSSNGNGFKLLSPDKPTVGSDISTSGSGFKLLSPDKSTVSSASSTMEDNLDRMKKEFMKLTSQPQPSGAAKVKTFAVNRDGDLISDNSDSSRSTVKTKDSFDDITPFSMSAYTGTAQDLSPMTSGNLQESEILPPKSFNDRKMSHDSDVVSRRSGQTSSGESNQKSSFTNITPDASLDMTGMSTLSQYTLNDRSQNNSAANGVNEAGTDNYIHQKFASLDNLISESKNLIARHKVIIDKNKQIEEEPNKIPEENSSQRKETPSVSVQITAKYEKPSFSSISTSDRSSHTDTRTDMDFTALSSFSSRDKSEDSQSEFPNSSSSYNSLPGNKSAPSISSQEASLSLNRSGKPSSDVTSLDYLAQHESGITEETPPEMTLGSELSISEAFNALNDSADSLQSFERHEESEGESLSMSRNFDEDSTQENLQEIAEARKHNFMIPPERRKAAAQGRSLVQDQTQDPKQRLKDDDHVVFRAVPVNVVAAPTLAMSVNVTGAQSPKSMSVNKGMPSVNDEKKSLETKEKEPKSPMTSKLPLNRALRPRGATELSPQGKDSGTKPSDSGAKPKHSAAPELKRSISAPSEREQPSGKSIGHLAGEIRQFGGSAGFSQRQTSSPSPKKTPPKVAPKPVRSKTDTGQVTKPAPPSGLSRTLSSWKKSRAVASKPASIPERSESPRDMPSPRDTPKNSIRVLPKDAPPTLTEEQRRLKTEDELYEKNIRAYNPRLFRLQHNLDTTDEPQQQGHIERPRPEARKNVLSRSKSSS